MELLGAVVVALCGLCSHEPLVLEKSQVFTSTASKLCLSPVLSRSTLCE